MEAGRQNSRQPPWEAGAEGDVATFGTWLRQQRELREVSLREVADVTKISIRYLEALEQDRFDVLPAPVFAKGFLRQYATYVGLKPDDVVNSYLNALQEQEPQEEEPLRSVDRRTSWEWASGLLLALLVVALLALVAFLRSMRSDGEAAPMRRRPRLQRHLSRWLHDRWLLRPPLTRIGIFRYW